MEESPSPYHSRVSRPRTVSVLFSDVVGSTALFAAMGDDAADSVRREHFDGVGVVIAEHGGQVVKGLGDGVMAVFDSAAGAVEAGVAIQRCSAELAASTVDQVRGAGRPDRRRCQLRGR